MKKNYYIGVDVGGTKTRAGLVSPSGKIIKDVTLPTNTKKGKKVILETITSAINEVFDSRVAGIGVGIAGSVDVGKGIYRRGPNFPASFKNIPLATHIKRKFKVPVAIDNDVHCFILGESAYGAGKGHHNVVGIALGTGVGGGIVIDGTLLRGRDNTAGEIGHIIMAENLARTKDRKYNDFEDFTSGTALSRMYKELTGKKVLATDVEDFALAGDKKALQVMNTAAGYFSSGIVSILHVLNPDIIIIGGGISRVKALWTPLKKDIRKKVVFPLLAKTPVVKATLGGEAMILGSAELVKQSLK